MFVDLIWSFWTVWDRVEYIEFVITDEFRTFSQNWGWISLTPAFSSTFFNVIYGNPSWYHSAHWAGRIYDSHSTIVARRCMDGQDCYASAFLFTSVAAMGAVAFSVVLHMRQTRHNEISQYLDWAKEISATHPLGHEISGEQVECQWYVLLTRVITTHCCCSNTSDGWWLYYTLCVCKRDKYYS